MIVILGLPRDSFAYTYSYTNENLEIFQEGWEIKVFFSSWNIFRFSLG